MSARLYTFYKNLSMNLVALRRGSRLDQKDFAKKCGLSRHQYMRAEGAVRSTTLQTLLKICETFDIELGDLFKDPYGQALKTEKREKVKVQAKSAAKISEEKYLSHINKNTLVKRMVFAEKQIRRFKLQNRVKFEIFVLKGELVVVSSVETLTLKSAQHLALDYNPQLSFENSPAESFKLASLRGAEILLVQTMIH